MKIEKLVLVIILFLTGFFMSRAWAMQNMTVTTGHGYYTWNGQNISGYDYPPGDYSVCSGLGHIEVPENQSLNTQSVNSAAYMQFFNQVGCN